MTPTTLRGWLIAIVISSFAVVTIAGMREPVEPPGFFEGQVLPLAEVLTKEGGKLDDDAAPFSLVLKAADGRIYTLAKDDGSRMFFNDKVLLRRPMRLTATPIPGSQILQVVQVHSYHKQALHEVYYWCDICAIKRYEKKLCECCNAPMELRETPVRP